MKNLSNSRSELDEIGPIIKLLRKEQDKTLNEVAQVADISKSHLWDIENKEGSPAVEKVEAISQALGVDPIAVILKAKAEKGLPPEKRKLLREFKPILEKLEKLLEELYDDDEGEESYSPQEEQEELEEAPCD